MARFAWLLLALPFVGCRAVLGIDALPELRDAGPSDAGAETTVDAKPDVDLAWSRWAVDPNGPPEDQFTFDDETVVDTVTTLIWQRYVDTNGSLRWDDAATFCAGLTLGGKKGWRLPTRIELASITDYRSQTPAISLRAFPNAPSDPFWTASTYAGDPSKAWVCRFDDGAYLDQDKKQLARFRCVHD